MLTKSNMDYLYRLSRSKDATSVSILGVFRNFIVMISFDFYRGRGKSRKFQILDNSDSNTPPFDYSDYLGPHREI